MKIAIIGLGSIGSRHIDNLISMGYHDLLGYDIQAKPDEGRLMLVDQFHEILDWKPEFALICTPVREHCWQAMQLLNAGAEVFIEKPMARNQEEALAILDLACTQKKNVAIGYMLRAYQPLKNLWRDSRDIQITEMEIWCHWDAPARYIDIMAETSHELDLALWFCGGVKEVIFEQKFARGGLVVLEHTNGAKTRIDIQGDQVTYRRGLSLTGLDKPTAWRKPGPLAASMTYGPEDLAQAYKEELHAFLELRMPYATAFDGLEVLRLLGSLK